VVRRRRLASAGAALALLSVVALGLALVAGGPGAPSNKPAASEPPPFRSTWSGSGLTLYGLTDDVLDLPGHLYDIQFADAEHGFALATVCPGGQEYCELSFAVTDDGGHVWQRRELPVNRVGAFTPPVLPNLVPVGPDTVGLVGEKAWIRGVGGWRPMDLASAGPIDSVGRDGILWARDGETCTPGPVYVWRADGTVGPLAHQPPLRACQAVYAVDGSWWVGGYAAGSAGPAVAVSRDGGRSWRPAALPGAPGGAWARVSPLASDVYVSVVSRRGGDPYPETLSLHAVYRSAGGRPFERYGPTTGAVLGEVVPLLDGRLVAAGPGFYVTRAGQFVRDNDSLPFVGRLARTSSGWVAYNLFNGNWSARSQNGVDWYKLNVH
jgi:hypothetical protein